MFIKILKMFWRYLDENYVLGLFKKKTKVKVKVKERPGIWT